MDNFGFEVYNEEGDNPPVAMPTTTPFPKVGNQPIELPFEEYKEESTSLTVQDVVNDPDRLSRIRNMMVLSKGQQYEELPAEQVMEDFMSHMRWVNTNEVSTGREAYNVTVASDEERAIYGEAYKVYDELGSIFSNGDGWNGTLDYAGAFLSSPSLYLGMGIGKVIGTGGTKAAATGIKSAVQAAVTQAAKEGADLAVQNAIRQQIQVGAVRQTAFNVALGSLATEVPVATLQDYLYQDTMIKAGAQDRYSVMQTAATALLSSASTLVPLGIHAVKSGSSLARAEELIQKSFTQRARNAAKKAAPELQAALEKAQADWLKLAQEGLSLDANAALRTSIRNWFFDINDESSFVRIMQRAGADFDMSQTGKFVRSMADFATSLDDEALEGMNRALEPLGIRFGEAVEIMASTMREAGQGQNLASQAAKFVNDYRNVTVSRQMAQDTIAKTLAEGEDADVPTQHVLGYLQSLWKRNIVSTLPTTVINVKGWAIAKAARSMADVTAAAGLYGRAGVKGVFGSGSAMVDVAKANAIIKNQAFLMSSLVDPFISSDAFFSMLEKAPKRIQKDVLRDLYGGVDNSGPARFGLSESNLGVRMAEGYTNFFQRISLIRAQDTLTKGVSGLVELDKISRINFGKGISQLIEDGETFRLTEDMWDKAAKVLMQDTFSETFRGPGPIESAARLIESISNSPGLGFFLPFGKFINNQVAFFYRYSPFVLAPPMLKIFKGKVDEDIGERLSRAMVGTIFTGMLVLREKDKQEQGLQWYEEYTDQGDTVNIGNLFPYSLYALIGRIIHNAGTAEGMSLDLFNQLRQQIGPLEAFGDIASPPFLRDLVGLMTDTRNPEQDDLFKGSVDFLGYVANNLGNIVGGYTRPMEVPVRSAVEQFVGQGYGAYQIDRKQVEGFEGAMLGLLRYTDEFFNLLGEENEQGVNMIGPVKESASSFGPVEKPPVAGLLTGTNYQRPRNAIDRVFGMVDKAPYLADSFTSGNAEYDAFINKHVTPLLDTKARALLDNQMFMKAPKSAQLDIVNKMIFTARQEVVSLLESGYIGSFEERMLNERRKLLVRDKQAVQRAKMTLGIETENDKLSLYEIEAIKLEMELERDRFQKAVE